MARFMNIRFPKVYLDRLELLNLSKDELYRRYRFNRTGIEFITELIKEDIEKDSRGSGLSPTFQVMTFLLYAASSTFQVHIASMHQIQQSSVSNVIRRVGTALAGKANRFIFFPIDDDTRRAKQYAFYGVSGFPGVVGLIDCTHIKIVAPTLEHERQYVNRKGYHSINVQCVVNHQGKFTNVVAKWPGSTHDAFILRDSLLWDGFESGVVEGSILGDSGYPNRRWLHTPYANPDTVAKERYNHALCATRVLIEQVFGRWKRRFHSLHSELRLKLQFAPTYIVACAVLHNIAIDLHQRNFDDDELEGDDFPSLSFEDNPRNRISANTYRDLICQHHFS